MPDDQSRPELLERLSDNTPCFRCRKGLMRLLKRRADRHGFFQCTDCRKIDEVAIVQQPDGKNVLLLIKKQWDEVLDESIEGMVRQLQQSVQGLMEWRVVNSDLLSRFQAVVSGWKELQYLIFCFIGGTATEIVVLPWQFTWIEADRELSASRTLAAVGFYKDA
ncbi:MAG: hypothetical protein JO099_18890, partial [Acidobacteriia bacterium]|nr:hypothetical protein [Terriglobia bacterium]